MTTIKEFETRVYMQDEEGLYESVAIVTLSYDNFCALSAKIEAAKNAGINQIDANEFRCVNVYGVMDENVDFYECEESFVRCNDQLSRLNIGDLAEHELHPKYPNFTWVSGSIHLEMGFRHASGTLSSFWDFCWVDVVEFFEYAVKPEDEFHYLYLAIGERNGDHEYTHNRTLLVAGDTNPSVVVENYVRDFYSGGMLSSDKEDEYEGDYNKWWLNNWKKISKTEYDVLRKFL